MATNKQIQKSVDKSKWLASEFWGEDMSGQMGYCAFCKHRTDHNTCSIIHEERVEISACATAYNRMVREANKEKEEERIWKEKSLLLKTIEK